MTYPIEDRAALVDREAVESYVGMLFGRVRWESHHFIGLRGIGEKGTPQEGVFRDEVWLQPGVVADGDSMLVAATVAASLRWAQHEAAAFVIPAVMGRAQGSAAAVESMVAVVVDLDTGPTTHKLMHAVNALGDPSIVVHSGGSVSEGMPKLHAYWLLEEPTEDVGLVVALRDELARKLGGDLQFGWGRDGNPFGRAHQPIRIAGSVHAKGGVPHPVRLFGDGEVYDLMDLATRIRELPPSEWAIRDEDAPRRALGPGLAFSASGTAFGYGTGIRDALVTDVVEGGEADRNRWTEFSRVAGHYIHTARTGAMSLEAAKEATLGWMSAHMIPPWPAARAEAEWHNLLQVDLQRHGPIVAVERREALVAPPAEGGEAVPLAATDLGLVAWAVHRWEPSAARTRKWLVHGLLQAGKPHLLVAEGGAGKTQLDLELALMVSTHLPTDQHVWMGGELTSDAGGIVVVITTEDDADEIAIRVRELDRDGKIGRAGDRLIIIPTASYGGAFPLVARDRLGNMGPSQQWLQLLEMLKRLPQQLGAPLKLVVIDTLATTMHGDENSATAMQEYARTAAMVCALGATLVVTHHPRKANTERPILDAEDMLAAVRGSGALVASFRGVIGIWHAHDFEKRLRELGEPPERKRLYRMAMLKANNPEALQTTRLLLRDERGVLVDVTDRERSARTARMGREVAWTVAAIGMAAAAGYPYVHSEQSDAGMVKRKGELPPDVQALGGREKLPEYVDALITSGKVVLVRRSGKGNPAPILDVPDGPFARGVATDPAGSKWSDSPMWGEYEYSPGHGCIVPAGTPSIQLPGMPGGDRPASH